MFAMNNMSVGTYTTSTSNYLIWSDTDDNNFNFITTENLHNSVTHNTNQSEVFTNDSILDSLVLIIIQSKVSSEKRTRIRIRRKIKYKIQ